MTHALPKSHAINAWGGGAQSCILHIIIARPNNLLHLTPTYQILIQPNNPQRQMENEKTRNDKKRKIVNQNRKGKKSSLLFFRAI